MPFLPRNGPERGRRPALGEVKALRSPIQGRQGPLHPACLYVLNSKVIRDLFQILLLDFVVDNVFMFYSVLRILALATASCILAIVSFLCFLRLIVT